MKIMFRVDASLSIGSGHVMRCLTLGNALRQRGHECEYICVNHDGNMIEQIDALNFKCHSLPKRKPFYDSTDSYSNWLGCSQQEDALLTADIIGLDTVDWLIVDNYALSSEWENIFNVKNIRLLVIDDLANRLHQCDLLLDQTFGRLSASYSDLTPAKGRLLVGTNYCLLRPEFADIRALTLLPRRNLELHNILISLGGIDENNITERVMLALNTLDLSNSRLTVVMGKHSPWKDNVVRLAREMQIPTNVLVNVRDMASLMADCDFAIGAAGSTTWERCCLGVPSALIAIADNQEFALSVLDNAGIVQKFDLCHLEKDIKTFFQAPNRDDLIRTLAYNCSSIVDGNGAVRVINEMEKIHGLHS